MCKTQCGGVTVFKGETGADGVGVTSTVDNGDGTFTITYTDGTTFTSSDLTGPQGPPGTGVSGTGQNQKIAFWDGVSSLSYNSLFSFNDSATVPTVTLLNSTDSLIQVNASSGFNHASNSFSQLTLQSFTDTAYPIARLKRQRGSNSAATPALSNDILGQLNAASETDNFSIEVRATEIK
jgi:hypothetical protein